MTKCYEEFKTEGRKQKFLDRVRTRLQVEDGQNLVALASPSPDQSSKITLSPSMFKALEESEEFYIYYSFQVHVFLSYEKFQKFVQDQQLVYLQTPRHLSLRAKGVKTNIVVISRHNAKEVIRQLQEFLDSPAY